VAGQKANPKAKRLGEKSWAEALKSEGIGLDREQEQCELPTGFRRDELQFGRIADRVPFPVSAKPKLKPKCVRR